MPSFKRRRAINIDEGYINALKHISEHHLSGKSSPTAVARLIFINSLGVIRAWPGGSSIQTVKRIGRKKGISMAESLWLSIRQRSRKSTFCMAKQFALKQSLGQSCAVNRSKRLAGTT